VGRALVVALSACLFGSALAGHDDVRVDPALKRYAGMVTALGAPDTDALYWNSKM
jgi:hypothetical protein